MGHSKTAPINWASGYPDAGQFYLVDSDVLITAKNLYYAFDICPGFWECFLHYHQQNRVFSVDRVRNELLSGLKTEDLVQWVSGEVPGKRKATRCQRKYKMGGRYWNGSISGFCLTRAAGGESAKIMAKIRVTA